MKITVKHWNDKQTFGENQVDVFNSRASLLLPTKDGDQLELREFSFSIALAPEREPDKYSRLELENQYRKVIISNYLYPLKVLLDSFIDENEESLKVEELYYTTKNKLNSILTFEWEDA